MIEMWFDAIEMLPEEDEIVIVVDAQGDSRAAFRTDDGDGIEWVYVDSYPWEKVNKWAYLPVFRKN